MEEVEETKENNQNQINNQESTAQTPRKKRKMIPGQDFMSLEELKKEFEIAEKNEEEHLCMSLISSMLDKIELDDFTRNKLQIQKIDILMKIGAYQDAVYMASDNAKDANKNNKKLTSLDLRFKAQEGLALSKTGKLIDGYLEALRAQGLTFILLKKRAQKKQSMQKILSQQEILEDNIDLGEGFEPENVFKENIQQIEEIIKIIRQEVKQTNLAADYLWQMPNQKDNTEGQVQPQVEFRNRLVHSIACGKNHTLMLCEGCTCANPYAPKHNCHGLYKCNKGCEVFGWGSNDHKQILGESHYLDKAHNIKKPFNVYYFQGLHIMGVAACENSSAAFDHKGDVYQWGANVVSDNDQAIVKVKTHNTVGKIVNLKMTENCFVVQNNKNQIFAWGHMKAKLKTQVRGTAIFQYDVPTQIIVGRYISQFQDFCIGNNHLILTDMHKKVWGLGNNEDGQLGLQNLDADQNYSKELVHLDIPEPKSIYTDKNCTFVVTKDGKVFYTGYLSEKRQQTKFTEVQIEQNETMLKIVVHGSEVYGFNDIGQCFLWKSDAESDVLNKFILFEPTKNLTFNGAIINRKYRFFYRTLFKPDMCKITQITENPKSYSPCIFRIDAFDMLGQYGIKVFYPIRVSVFLSQKNNMDNKDLHELAINYFKQRQQEFQETRIYCFEISNSNVKNLEMIQNKEDLRTYNLEVTMDRSDDYYMWVMINEVPIANNPVHFDVASSKEERVAFKLMCQEEMVKLYDQQEKMIQEQEKQQERLDNLEQKELAIARFKNTQKRALEVMNEFEKQKAKEKLIKKYEEEVEKCRVGGGYDLLKVNKIREMYEYILEMKLNFNKPNKVTTSQQVKVSPYSQTYQKRGSVLVTATGGVFGSMTGGNITPKVNETYKPHRGVKESPQSTPRNKIRKQSVMVGGENSLTQFSQFQRMPKEKHNSIVKLIKKNKKMQKKKEEKQKRKKSLSTQQLGQQDDTSLNVSEQGSQQIRNKESLESESDSDSSVSSVSSSETLSIASSQKSFKKISSNIRIPQYSVVNDQWEIQQPMQNKRFMHSCIAMGNSNINQNQQSQQRSIEYQHQQSVQQQISQNYPQGITQFSISK